MGIEYNFLRHTHIHKYMCIARWMYYFHNTLRNNITGINECSINNGGCEHHVVWQNFKKHFDWSGPCTDQCRSNVFLTVSPGTSGDGKLGRSRIFNDILRAFVGEGSCLDTAFHDWRVWTNGRQKRLLAIILDTS